MAVPGDARGWADYAGACFMSRDFTHAKEAFQEAMNLDNSLQANLRNGLGAASFNEQNLARWKTDSLNADNNITLAQGYMGTPEFYPEARRLLNKAVSLRPGDKNAMHMLDSLGGLEQKAKMPPARLLK